MPRRDGTGPMGSGAMTGRGIGSCTGANTAKYGAGYGCRLGRGFAVNQTSPETQKELLQEQRDVLKSQLEIIDKQLENV